MDTYTHLRLACLFIHLLTVCGLNCRVNVRREKRPRTSHGEHETRKETQNFTQRTWDEKRDPELHTANIWDEKRDPELHTVNMKQEKRPRTSHSEHGTRKETQNFTQQTYETRKDTQNFTQRTWDEKRDLYPSFHLRCIEPFLYSGWREKIRSIQ